MKINKGVEWAAHACALLGVLPRGWALSADALAAYHDVPPAYMAKQMQALSAAGLVVSSRGAAGGYRLARAPDAITLKDVFLAVEGGAPSFRCSEVRQNGPCGAAKAACKRPCGIAASFYAAEAAFRDALAGVTIADVTASAAASSDAGKAAKIAAWVQAHASGVEG